MLAARQTPGEQARCASWFAGADRPALVAVGAVPLPARPDIRQCYVMNLPASLALAEADLDAAGKDCLDATAEFFASRRDIDAASDGAERDALARAVAWVENDGCARQFLALALHGRTTGPCGNCGWCLGKRGGLLPPDE